MTLNLERLLMKNITPRPLGLIQCSRLVAVACVAALVLTACGPSDAEKAAAADAEAKVRAATKARLAKQAAVADPTSNMAHAVVIDKSQAVLDLKYDIAHKPMVGEPIEIELALVPLYEGDSMNATIASANPGLTLEGNLTPSTTAVKAGTPWKVNVVAHATEPTAYYFTVLVDQYAAGVRSTRNFAIPFFVSSTAVESSAHAANETQGAAGEPKTVTKK
jgi:hypothetical protein